MNSSSLREKLRGVISIQSPWRFLNGMAFLLMLALVAGLALNSQASPLKALPLVGAEGIRSLFEPANGNWGDAANWTNGVPTHPKDHAQIKVGVRNVTNDLQDLTIDRIAIQSEAGKEIHFWGNPISLNSIGFGSRFVHFHNDIYISDWLNNVDGNVYFHGLDNRITKLRGSWDYHFAPSGGLGTVTNATTGGKPLQEVKMSSEIEKGRLFVDSKEGTYPVVDIDKFTVEKEIGELSPDSRSLIRIYEPQVNGMVANSGSGRVQLEPAGDALLDSVNQRSSGTLAFAAPQKGERPAAGAVVHLDASDPSAFDYKDGDPAKGVIRWNGVNGASYAYHDGCVADDGTQVLPKRVEDAVNGMAIVDFGPWVQSSNLGKDRAKGGYLILGCGADRDYDIYTAFVVECCKNFIFTSHESGHGNIFHGESDWNQNIILTRNEAHVDFRNPKDTESPGTGLGLLHFNGEKKNAWDCRMRGENIYDSIAVRAETKAIKIGRLALDRKYRSGAAKIAEIILYNRKLSDEEFACTETYLRNKWQNAGVPWNPPSWDYRVGTMVSESSTPFEIEEGATVQADRMDARNNNGIRSFTGGGKLKLARATDTMQNIARPVTIQNGTLALTSSGKTLAAPESCPIQNCMNHLDASIPETFVLAEDGKSVKEWRDVDYANNGFAACYAGEESGNRKPRRVEGMLNGLAGVDFGPNNSKMCLLWNKTNTTMRTIFMVYAGPRADVNFLLGDTYRNNQADFHAGRNCMFFPYGYTADAIRSADLRVNGEKVTWNGHYLPNEPCVVMIASTDENKCMSAAAFAVDRWGHPNNGKNFRTGGQQICEAVFYDRILGIEEREAVQNWLMKKWLPRSPAGYALRPGEEQLDEIASAAASNEKAAVEIPPNESVAVGAISGGAIAKTGAGTLAVGSIADLKGELALEEGVLHFSARKLPVDWTPPAGYVADGSEVLDTRAVFVVLDQAAGKMTLPNFTRKDWDVLRIDGVKQANPHSTSYPGGMHVVSVVLSTRQTVSAQQLAPEVKEQLIYQRPVTDLERRDIEAYLMRKWMGVSPSGYQGAELMLSALSSDGGTFTVEDPSAPVMIGRLSGTKPLPVSMSVTVGSADRLPEAIQVKSGTTLSFSPKMVGTEENIPTEGLIARFDISHPESFDTEMVNGTNFVTQWRDLTGQHIATANQKQRPWLIPGDCNGLDVLCTGPFCSTSYQTEKKHLTGWMEWDNPGCKARTVIEVIGVQEGGNFVVCGYNRKDGDGTHVVHRGGDYAGYSYLNPLLAPGRIEPTQSLYGPNAFFAINGEKVDRYNTPFPSPSYHSVTVRVDPDSREGNGEQGYFYIGQFGTDRTYRWGGQRICEVIAYDRVLSDEEVGKLESYLQQKWFDRNYRDYCAAEVNSLVVEQGGMVDLGSNDRIFRSFGGAGTIKGGILNVSEVFAPNGLTVEGTLNFVGSNGIIRLPVDQPPVAGTKIDLGSAAQITGDWKSWQVEPLGANQQASLAIVDGHLIATVYGAGSILILQ